MVAEDKDFLRELQKEFLDELQFLLEACEESYLKIEQPEARNEELAKIFRLAHSIKGAGAAVEFHDLAAFAHVLEDCLAALRAHPEFVDTSTITLLLKCGDAIKQRVEQLRWETPPVWNVSLLTQELKDFIVSLEERRQGKTPSGAAPAALGNQGRTWVEEPLPAPTEDPAASVPVVPRVDNTIKVDGQRVETILNLVGELVVLKSQIVNETHKHPASPRLHSVVALLDKSIRELQERTLSMRLTPLKSLFLKVQRVARDLSVRLKKPVEFVLEGLDLEIDRHRVEQLSDPLIHLVRNCIDHGIETPAVRATTGKPSTGHLRLSAKQVGARVVLTLSDDGAGIDRAKVVRKAMEQGLLPVDVKVDALSDSAIHELLFAPGFSTADKVTDISGRGVGMNVVKENLEAIRGKIQVESTPGQGTRFTISIPLTTAITDGMLVSVDDSVYILPIHGIREMVDFDEAELVGLPAGRRMLDVRGKLFPYFSLSHLLRTNPAARAVVPGRKSMIVVYEHEMGFVALEVDAVLGQAQVVTKPIREGVKESEAIAGAAILGDGKVALLLDVAGVVAEAA